MKHNIRITLLLLAMFLVTQFIGLAVIQAYSPHVEEFVNATTGAIENVTILPQLPYGMQPPEMKPEVSLTSIIFGIILATLLIFLFRKLKARLLLKLWFFSVVVLSIAIVFNSALSRFLSGEVQLLAFALAFPLAFYKIFERNILVHNLTELLIYPGIAVIFVPLLSIWTAIALLIAIALYDLYAVWHSGFMQKLAKFQIQQLHIFTGFFVPYVAKKDRIRIQKIKMQRKKGRELKEVKIKVNLAILGGGDITFPLIFAGVILRATGLGHALLISLTAAVALFLLFTLAKKGKFYPAMLFLSPACIIAWLAGLLF
jgi:presenilin-like A22 family membrane protease